MRRAPQSADAGSLIVGLGDLVKKTEQDLLGERKEIGAAEIRVHSFEKLSRDPQFGKHYSEGLKSARVALQKAQKREKRLAAQLEEVRALLEQSLDLAERLRKA
jgi:hypothetical protein